MGIEEVLTAPRSPWQNPIAERVIGSIRRECMDHVMVLSVPRMPKWPPSRELRGALANASDSCLVPLRSGSLLPS